MPNIKRVLGTAILLNDEVCVRVRDGGTEHVVLELLVFADAAAGVTWLLTLEQGEGITVWTTTGKAFVVFQATHREGFCFLIVAPHAVQVRREEDLAMPSWGIPQWPMPEALPLLQMGVLA